jgi:SAM-dependent methyltransferase
MYLSHYLWPHHYRLLRFFNSEVIPQIDPAPSVFYDVGLGTGMYSRETMRAFPNVRGKGFDISEYSIEFTRRVLQAYDVADRYEFVKGNIFETELPLGTGDFIVSQEVLEHLEDPGQFCEILHDLTKPGGKAYITAAVNAAHSDHIYLFRSPQEVQAILENSGWNILQSKAEYAYEGVPNEFTPCVAGFFCER